MGKSAPMMTTGPLPVPRLEIDTGKLARNAAAMLQFCLSRGIELTAVTKGVCGSPVIAKTFLRAGIRSLADSRVSHLERLRKSGIDAELLLIRSPVLSEIPRVVAVADGSVNTELEVVRRLDNEAERQGKIHRVLLMVELGDLREGILGEDLACAVDQVLRLPHVRLQGLGANLACFSGVPPSTARMDALSCLSSKMQGRFGLRFERISGGNSSNYQWMQASPSLGLVNHVRIGESILLGCDSLSHEALHGFETDAFSLVTEVIELKDKQFQGRMMRRGILALGRQDLDITAIGAAGLQTLGATSDHLVVDASERPLRVGEEVSFAVGYNAVMTAMASPYVEKIFLPEGAA